KIDILVNNAGAAGPPGMPFTNNTEEDWDRTFAVNTKSVFLTCKAITPHFIERKAGRIVNIASIAGPISAPTMPPYSVAKMGVITLTRIIAKEPAPHGVTVTAICPGVLWTDFWQKLAAPRGRGEPIEKMNFDFSDREEAFRKEVRGWLEANLPDDLRGRAFAASRADRDEVRKLRAWQRRMCEAGYVGLDWPREFGGRGAT